MQMVGQVWGQIWMQREIVILETKHFLKHSTTEIKTFVTFMRRRIAQDGTFS